jgi:hypothetical protein
MKRFQFSLDRVRSWRAGQAALEGLKLEQLRENLEALKMARRNIAVERSSSEQAVLGQPSIDASELQSLDAYRLHARARIRDIENRERQIEAQLEQQRQRVIIARRDAELLERLKRKALDEWQAASGREQENLAAELFLAKRARRS